MGSKVIGRGRDKASKFSLSPNNVRKKIDKQKLLDLMVSIKETGEVLEPIIINTKNEVVAGGRRLRAATELNIEIDWTMKEYDGEVDEILDSGQENLLHHEIDVDDKIRMAMILIDKHHLLRKTIALRMGVDIQTVKSWYDKGKGPQEIDPEEEQRKLNEEENKKKETDSQESLEESEKRIAKLKEIAERKGIAKEMWDAMPLRRTSVVGKIIKTSQFKDDIEQIIDLMKFSKEAPLHMLEDMYKDLRRGLPVDLEFKKEILEHPKEYMFRTVRVHKLIMKKMKPIMKRRRIDWNAGILEALLLWLKKWSIEENWEGELSRELPEMLK